MTIETKWSFNLGNWIPGGAAIGLNGTVYIGSNDGQNKGTLYALKPNDEGPPVVEWEFETGGLYTTPIIGTDGTVYVGTFDGTLLALDSRARDEADRLKWSFEAGRRIIASPAIGADGTVYFASDNMLYAIGTNPPAAPDNVQSTAGHKKVTLTWDPVDGAHGYRVYQFKGSTPPANEVDWLLINDDALVMDTAYTIEQLSAGEPYWFAVQAVRKGGSPSELSDRVTATPTTQVKHVVPLDAIHVARGTQLQDVPLPVKVGVQLDDDNQTVMDVAVDWNLQNAGYDARQPGTYTITGDLELPNYVRNPNSLQAEISVIVNRPPPAPSLSSRNANLKTLEVWAGGTPLALTPAFHPDTLSYTATTAASRVVIKAVTEHAAAHVTWQDQAVDDSIEIDLQPGENTIQLVVQAGDGSRQTYTLVIGRVSYTDLAGHWAASFIQQVTAAGIVSGYPDGTFKPDDSITRAEFTVMLIGALQPDIISEALPFVDTDKIGAWARQAVAQAVQLGIITGYEDGHFRPDANITRAEIALMIARALQLPTAGAASTGFADDADIPQWAKGAVAAMRQLGLIEGRGGNRFAPNDTATRAEATVMVLRIMPLVGDSPR